MTVTPPVTMITPASDRKRTASDRNPLQEQFETKYPEIRTEQNFKKCKGAYDTLHKDYLKVHAEITATAKIFEDLNRQSVDSGACICSYSLSRLESSAPGTPARAATESKIRKEYATRSAVCCLGAMFYISLTSGAHQKTCRV